MTDTTQMETADRAEKPNLPTYIAYHIRDIGDGKGFWTRIGSAWAHRDGKGFNIQVDVVPLEGRITLRVAGEKAEQ